MENSFSIEVISAGDPSKVRVSASNEDFAGTTEVYTNLAKLSSLAHALKGFPNTVDQKVEFSSGHSGESSYVGVKFYCFSSSGHTAVLVNLEADTAINSRKESKHYISLEIQFESNAIDKFVHKLESAIEAGSGIADLIGISPFTQYIA